MFGTLKSSGTSDDPYLIETTKPPFNTQDVGKHQTNACTTCREKKLKCTGEKTGCRRCRTKNNECIYLEVGESRNGHSRRAGTTAASERPYRQSQKSFPVNDDAGTSTTSGQQKTDFGQRDQEGTRNGPRRSSDSSGKNSNTKDRQPTSVSNQSFEAAKLSGNPGTDNFDIGDLDTTENYNNFSMPFGFENDTTSLRNGFDPSEILHDDLWMEDLPQQLQSDQLDASMADWSTSPHRKSPNPSPFQTRQSTRPPTRQGYTGNIGSAPSRSSTSNSNFESHNNSEFTSNPTTIGQACPCIPIALKIDEQLKLYTNAKGGRSIAGSGTVRKVDEDLHYLKQAIMRCSNMLDCKSCTGQSSVMMLILSICEKMLQSFGQLSSAFLAPPSPHTSRRHSAIAGSAIPYNDFSMNSSNNDANGFNSNASNDDAGSGAPLRIFGDAMLDTEDEVNVVKMLAIARMKNLGSLLSRLEKLISSNRWSGHGDILESIRSSYRRTAGTISSLEG